jgi:hypothetical protein
MSQSTGPSKMLVETSGAPPPPRRKTVPITVRPQTFRFRGTAQQRTDLNPLHFYLWGHIKPLVYSAPIENEETLHQTHFSCLSNNSEPPQDL